jgi:hypothetical protein
MKKLSFFEQPWILFGMIPMTIVFFLFLFFIPSVVIFFKGSFFLVLLLFWILLYKIAEKLTNNFKFYIRWLVKKRTN